MDTILDRRTFTVLCALAAAGCTGDDDGEGASSNGGGNGDGSGDGSSGGNDGGANQDSNGNEADPDFEKDVDPSGSVQAADQEGQGEQIKIQEAQANVDYKLIVDYSGGTIESSVISGGNHVSGETIPLDAQITSEQTVEVAVVSADGEQLDSTSFRYVPAPPGPSLNENDVFNILKDRTGWGILDEWSHFRSFTDSFSVNSSTDGYDVHFEWIHGTNGGLPLVGDPAKATEKVVAKMNAAFFQALYQSQYELTRVEAVTHQFRGHEADGSKVVDRSGQVVVAASTARSVNWDNLVENGEFPQGLKSVADKYQFTFREKVE